MIQRIQTLFLLCACGLVFSLFFARLIYAADYTISYTEYNPFLILTILTFIINIITIAMYRHRILQMRLCIYNILVLLGYQGWIAYLFFTREEGVAFSITAVFPIVAAILTFIAMRYIARDEALVQSINSLRKSRRGKKGKK